MARPGPRSALAAGSALTQLVLIWPRIGACISCRAGKAVTGWGPAWCQACADELEELTLDQISARRGYRRCVVREGEITQSAECCGLPTEPI